MLKFSGRSHMEPCSRPKMKMLMKTGLVVAVAFLPCQVRVGYSYPLTGADSHSGRAAVRLV